MIKGRDVVDAIENSFYERDLLNVVSMLYSELIRVISTKRNAYESFCNFELRFCAQLSRFNTLTSHTNISDTMSALILLANANIDSRQQVSILAAASPSSDPASDSNSNDSFRELVHYESASTVLRQ